MAKITTTVTLSPGLVKQLDRVAEQLDRSRSWVVERAAREALQDGVFASEAEGKEK